LKITSSSATIGTSGDYVGAYLVNFTIKNTGSQTAQNVWVVGTFYNSTGTVVGVGYTNYLTATLAPSKTVSSQIAAFDLNQNQVPLALKISKYSLLVQTQGPILQGTAPIASSSPGSSSSPPPTQHANNSNNSSTLLTYAIVIGVVIVAIAGTILALSKRKPSQTVKEAKASGK
jgi:uncharacterized membrane protein